MDFLGNYICAFYPWCLLATPFIWGMLLAGHSHFEKVPLKETQGDDVGGYFIMSFLIGTALTFGLTKFVLGRVSISFKKKD